MDNKKLGFIGFVILTLGTVGYTIYPTQEEIPELKTGEVVQEIKHELADISTETIFKGDQEYKIEYVKTYEKDGAMRDTPRAGWKLVTDKNKMIKRTTIIETPQEKIAREQAQKALDDQQEIDSQNEDVFRKIGELKAIKEGKIEVGENTTKEDNQINSLKGQLK
jgi:hypothetical protein